MSDEMNSQDQQQEKKKKYVKPLIKQVDLRPEEAVLGACKSSTQSGPAAITCTFLTGCSSIGS